MPKRDELQIKTFGILEIKDAERGEVTAVVATLNVVDKDGDVILPGAADGAKIKLSEYSHSIIEDGAPPVGKGRLYDKGTKLMMDGTFFMEVPRARDSFYTVKGLGEDSEWSIGFLKRVQTVPITDELRARFPGVLRIIKKMFPVEASPVLIGAGVDTYTVSTKDAEIDEETQRKAAEEQARKDAEEAQALETKRLAEDEAQKVRVQDAMNEYHRVQRALRRMNAV